MKKTKYAINKTLIYIFLILLAVICIIPFWLMIVNSTRSGVEISRSFSLLFGNNLKENWEQLFDYFNLFKGMFNSLLVSIPATLLNVYFSALCAYGLVMYEFRGNRLLTIVIIVFMMIPQQLGLIGFYNLVSNLGLIDSYVPLIIPSIASCGTVFFLRQYLISSYPRAIAESARIDGASEFYSFNKLAIPIMGPALATMGIMAFIGSWNNYLTPMIILNDTEKFTLPVMMGTLHAATDLQKNQGAIYLAVSISVIPILLVFVFASKYIIGGVSAGAVKG